MLQTPNIRTGEDDDMDWYEDVQNTTWTKKYGEIIDPHNREILANVVLTINGFTRRAVSIKMTRWFGQYATDQIMAGYLLDRITSDGAAVFDGDGSWVRMNRTTLHR